MATYTLDLVNDTLGFAPIVAAAQRAGAPVWQGAPIVATVRSAHLRWRSPSEVTASVDPSTLREGDRIFVTGDATTELEHEVLTAPFRVGGRWHVETRRLDVAVTVTLDLLGSLAPKG